MPDRWTFGTVIRNRADHGSRAVVLRVAFAWDDSVGLIRYAVLRLPHPVAYWKTPKVATALSSHWEPDSDA